MSIRNSRDTRSHGWSLRGSCPWQRHNRCQTIQTQKRFSTSRIPHKHRMLLLLTRCRLFLSLSISGGSDRFQCVSGDSEHKSQHRGTPSCHFPCFSLQRPKTVSSPNRGTGGKIHFAQERRRIVGHVKQIPLKVRGGKASPRSVIGMPPDIDRHARR